MLINFTLVPVEKVPPWGYPDNPSLSWFGLTDGQYWINAGESTLFEYSSSAQDGGAPRYCDYQVVRLYEDLMEMLPHILEPIPPTLVQYVSGDTATAWLKTYESWCERNEDVLDEDQFWRIVDASRTWADKRKLDSHYLSPSANISIWSDADNVHFSWDNRTSIFKEQLAWTALYGTYKLPRAAFMSEIESFHSRLMEQMAQRVDKVLSGAIAAEIHIDLDVLKREQEQRCHTLRDALMVPQLTDWHVVEDAIHGILKAQSLRSSA